MNIQTRIKKVVKGSAVECIPEYSYDGVSWYAIFHTDKSIQGAKKAIDEFLESKIQQSVSYVNYP